MAEQPAGARNEPLDHVDAAFLAAEHDARPMHVGGVFVFDPPAEELAHAHVTQEGVRRLLAARLHRVPRYRQRVVTTPLHLGHPWWVDDPEFDLDDHVHGHTLSGAADRHELLEEAAAILAGPLDRDRPLWELHVLDGLAEGRVALVGKIHHAVADGVAGLGLATTMLQSGPADEEAIPEPRPWEPEPAPSAYERARAAVAGELARPSQLAEAVRGLLEEPAEAAGRLGRVGRGVASLLSTQRTGPAPASPLNHRPDRRRRLAGRRLELAAFQEVADTFGVTVNDTVLAVVSEATGRWLRARGEDTDGMWLRVLVPVSVRGQDEPEQVVGNRVAAVFVELPMFPLESAERLRLCHERMTAVKQARQVDGARAVIDLAGLAPPPVHDAATRIAAHLRFFNFAITNVPGPTTPLFCLGARLRAAYPFLPLGPDQPFAVGVTSVGGVMSVAATGDGAFIDLHGLAPLLEDALEELRHSAATTAAPADLDRWRTRAAAREGN